VFIKWRTYQRQLNGIKGDKYIQQPIIVKSYRIGIKNVKQSEPELYEKFKDDPDFKKDVKKPRQKVIFKLPSYPVCMTIYFRSPEFMKQRFKWWERVDAIFEELLEVGEDFTEEVVKKLKADIEKNVPRITPAEVEQLKVVLNDLPLHL